MVMCAQAEVIPFNKNFDENRAGKPGRSDRTTRIIIITVKSLILAQDER